MDTNEVETNEEVVDTKTLTVEGQTYVMRPRMSFKATELDCLDWSGTNIHDSIFDGCDLGHGIFIGTKLQGTAFRSCNLKRADFTGADLRGGSLNGSDLSRAQFRNANLSDTDMMRTDLSGASGIVHLGMPHFYDIYLVQNDAGVRIKAGCRWMTYRRAVEYWNSEGDEKPLSQPLLAYIREIVRIKEWNLGPLELTEDEKKLDQKD
jgi:hypothetical protein